MINQYVELIIVKLFQSGMEFDYTILDSCNLFEYSSGQRDRRFTSSQGLCSDWNDGLIPYLCKHGALGLTPVAIQDTVILLNEDRKEANMLWTIFVILLILWGLGLMTGYTLGGVIHALLVIAIVVVLIQFIQGRRRV